MSDTPTDPYEDVADIADVTTPPEDTDPQDEPADPDWDPDTGISGQPDPNIDTDGQEGPR